MDINQILNTYDGYFARNDAHGAYEYITARMAEARAAGNWQNELTMLSEVIGFCRKKLMITEGKEYIARANAVIREHGLEEQEAAATTWLNCATTMRAFGEPEISLDYFRKTEAIYKQKMGAFDYKYASLYNNMALVYSDIGSYEKAEELAAQAVDILITDPESAAELASTYISQAVMFSKEADARSVAEGRGHVEPRTVERVCERVRMAMALLDPEGELPDQYYAYMCMVCSKSLDQMGFTAERDRLVERGREFYAKISGGKA